MACGACQEAARRAAAKAAGRAASQPAPVTASARTGYEVVGPTGTVTPHASLIEARRQARSTGGRIRSA